MKKETALQIDLHTLKLAIAYLLAQEAKRSGNDLNTLQEAMVAHFIATTQAAGQDHPQASMELEVALTNSVDALFAIARPLLKL